MSYPINEQIVQAVVTALEGITTVNGYAYDMEISRPRRTGEGFQPTHLGVSVQVLSDGPAGEGVDGSPAGLQWTLTVACDIGVRVAESDTTAMDQVLLIASADVRKALMADPQFGGLAIDSRLVGATFYASDGMEGVAETIEIDYRVAENDPYTQI